MPKKIRLIVVVVLILVSLVWISSRGDKNDLPQDLSSFPKVELSNLSDDLQASLSIMEEKAKEFKRDQYNLNINIPGRMGKGFTAAEVLVLQTYHEENGELEEKRTSMPQAFIGLNEKDLSNFLSEWEVKEYQPDKALVIYRQVNEVAPNKDFQHLGIKDGKVAIFYGKNGNEFMKQQTDIAIEELPARERETLESGIVFHSEEELLSILESLIRED